MWFLFGVVSSSSGCLGWAALFYCGPPWAFRIINIYIAISYASHLLAHLRANKNIIMSSFTSSRDIQKKEGGPN